MYLQPRSKARRGVTVVETAVVILAFFVLVFGMLDLGIGVFNYHVLSNAARHMARQAIIHGDRAPPEMNQWPPDDPSNYDYANPFITQADESNEIAETLRPYLAGMDASAVTLRMEWISGANANGTNRVQVTLTAPFRPTLTCVFGPSARFPMRASSTMLMAH